MLRSYSMASGTVVSGNMDMVTVMAMVETMAISRTRTKNRRKKQRKRKPSLRKDRHSFIQKPHCEWIGRSLRKLDHLISKSEYMIQQAKNWYVVYTKPRWEKKVAKQLEQKKIEHYCPLNKVQRQWSDRKKIILEPLFSCYVFVCLDETQ